MSTNDVDNWATMLIEDLRAGRAHRALWGDAGQEPPSLDDAYLLQDAVLAGLSDLRGGVGGYKVAITAKPMQEMMGLTAPLGGLVHAGDIHAAPFTLSMAAFQTPALEFEVTVRIGTDVPLSGVPYDRATIAPFVGEVLTSFEIVDTRGAAMPTLGAVGLVADRCGCAGAVVGTGTDDWSALDLETAAVEVEWNGEIVDTGVTGAAMGHPFEGLAWIANHLSTRGRTLDAGQIVLTGSAFAPKPVASGDRVTYRIAGLGEASIIAVD